MIWEVDHNNCEKYEGLTSSNRFLCVRYISIDDNQNPILISNIDCLAQHLVYP